MFLECVGDYGGDDGKERVEQASEEAGYVDNAQVLGGSDSLGLNGESNRPEEDHHVCHPPDVQLHWHRNAQHSCNSITINDLRQQFNSTDCGVKLYSSFEISQETIADITFGI